MLTSTIAVLRSQHRKLYTCSFNVNGKKKSGRERKIKSETRILTQFLESKSRANERQKFESDCNDYCIRIETSVSTAQ